MHDGFARPMLDLRVAETGEGRGHWLDQPSTPVERRAELLAATILVVPHLPPEGPSFPVGTAEFIEHLRDALGASGTVDIAISPEAYSEIALHSKAWRLPTLIVSAVFVPIVVNILSNRIDELLPGHKKDDVAEIELVIEAPDRRSLKVTYKGDPAEMGRYLDAATSKFIASTTPPAVPPAADKVRAKDKQ